MEERRRGRPRNTGAESARPGVFLQNIEKAGIEGSERGSEGDERERGQKKDEIQLDQLPEAVGQDREKTGEGARCTPFVSQDDTSLRFVL